MSKTKKQDAPASPLLARLAEIRGQFGHGPETADKPAKRFRTRFHRFDAALGGGLTAGSLVELYGMEDSCKSSLALSLASDVQRASPEGKRLVVLLNFERVFDPKWAATLGLDLSPECFYQSEPLSLEAGVGEAIQLLKTGAVCALIVDSIFAAASERGSEAVQAWGSGEGGHAGMAAEARAWGSALPTFNMELKKSGAVALFVNQARIDFSVGGAPKKSFMPPKLVATRGATIPFFAHMRLEMRASNLDPNEYKGESKDTAPDGRQVRIKIVKNKTSGDRRATVTYSLIRGVGFDTLADTINLALECGAISGGGGGHYVVLPGTEDKPVRSRENLVALLRDNDKIRQAVEREVEKHLSKNPLPKESENTDGDA